MATKVIDSKGSRRSRREVRVTSQNQVSIPVELMRQAGIKPGDHLRAWSDAKGRIVFEPVEDAFSRYAGTLTGAFDRESIEKLRDEWDRY